MNAERPAPDVLAWNRARLRNRVELVAAIAAGLGLTVMFSVFCNILSR